MSTLRRCLCSLLYLGLIAGCGGDEEGGILEATWVFEAGDCASNGVETVKVEATSASGAPSLSGEFACADGAGELGELPSEGASYSITGQGLNAEGMVLAENFGQTASFPDGRAFSPIEITLRPKSAAVTVSWGGCPSGVVLPYFITIYRPPAMAGGELSDAVTSTQEGCASGQATLMNVPPGDYVVELDSRAVTPMVYSTKMLTVRAGADASVDMGI